MSMMDRKIIASMLMKITALERSLRAVEVSRNILRRTVHQLRKDHAKERVKLKREIDLLRNSP